MKAIKYTFFGLSFLIVVFLGVGFLLPDTTHVERSVEIDRKPETIFPLINSMQKFNLWSPWAKIDPSAKTEYSGPEEGVGSSMRWESDDDKVGKGAQTIEESKPSESVKTRLDFADGSKGYATVDLKGTEEGKTLVTWSYDMSLGNSPMMRYMGLLMDGMLGSSYEMGLQNLKSIVESKPEIVGEVVSYQAGGTQMQGYLAYPKGVSNAPGVLVVHEWWGHNDYSRKRATMLAEQGYVAFALDMYGDGKSTGHPKEANAFMTEVLSGDGLIKERFTAALDLLRNNTMTSDKVAALGYCFGGGVVLSMARAGVELEGVASFHGSLQGLAPIADGVKSEMLVFNGADDPFVPQELRETFKSEMTEAGLNYQFIDYPGAVHAFTNPGANAKGEEFGLPLQYNQAADEDSWAKTLVFLEKILK